MRKRLLIALILVAACGSAYAQTSSVGNETGTTTTSDDDSAPAPKRTTPVTTPETRKGPARSDTPRSNNPRWHSFLPGMFR